MGLKLQAPYETQLDIEELLYPVPGAEISLKVAIPTL